MRSRMPTLWVGFFLYRSDRFATVSFRKLVADIPLLVGATPVAYRHRPPLTRDKKSLVPIENIT